MGKTELVRTLATEYDLQFIPVSPADIFGSYVGESEANLRNIWSTAYRNAPSIIFLDEAEALLSNRLHIISILFLFLFNKAFY